MKTLAAVLVETGRPLEMADLEVPDLKPGQVLVEVAYSGVCHTQVLECRGYRGHDRFLPHCLGHEGTGVVRQVGEGVTKVSQGQPVIMSWIKGSGADVPGTIYGWGQRQVNAGGVTTFGRLFVVSENRLTVLPPDVPLDEAALLGCAVPTGMGAVFNAASARPGQSIAIFGTGGVGLCAVAGANIAGCSPIIAVDIQDSKLELARRMGATHQVQAARNDPLEAIGAICPGGVDLAIEASGRPEVMAQALQSVRSQGGASVVIGNARHGERVDLDPVQLNMGKRLIGTWGGDSLPDRDYPRFCRLIVSGRLDLSPLITRTYRLEEVNEALDDLESGKVARPLIQLSSELSLT